MSIFSKHNFLRPVKWVLTNTFYHPGKTARILWGPLKGYRFTVNHNAGWAPIYGGWESAAQKVYLHLIKTGEAVYDLGANTGIHSLLFAKLVGRTGKVYAFEPLPDNRQEIENIKHLNQVENIQIIDKAISNYSGTATFKIGDTNKQGSLIGIGCETGTEIEVYTTTLDELVTAERIKLPHFVKIDIEGSEADALDGFVNSIVHSYPIFAIDLHTPEQDIRVGNFFKQYGYKVYRLNNETAQHVAQQKSTLTEIHNLELGWPHPEGIWGTIIAIHSQSPKVQAANILCVS